MTNRSYCLVILSCALMCAACGGDDDGGAGDIDAGLFDAAPGGPCDSLTCENGTCVEAGATATCECEDGWEGDTCATLTPPPQQGLVLWLDADDPTNTGNAATGPQAVWVDKTGTTSNFVAADDEQPTAIAGPNGRTVFQFDGINDWMVSTDFAGLTDVANYTIIVVGYGGVNEQTFLAGTELVGNENHGLLIETTNANAAPNVRFLHRTPFGLVGGDDLSTAAGAVKTDALNRLWMIREGGTQLVAHVNTELGEILGGTSADLPTNVNLVLGRLANDNPERFLQGQIAEVLIYVGARAPNATPELVSYLQAKWGVD